MRAAPLLMAATALSAAAVWYAAPPAAEPEHCVVASVQDARDLYARYAELLRRGDVEALAAAYSPDAVLMGPGHRLVRLGRPEIANYYSDFLKRRPTVAPSDHDVRVECNALDDVGSETLSLHAIGLGDAATSSRPSVSSRFLLSYKRFGDQWLIVRHRQEVVGASSPSSEASTSTMVSASQEPVVTGSNPRLYDAILAPRSLLHLPASPPVILSSQRPLLPPLQPTVAIDRQAIDRLIASAKERSPVVASDVVLPRPDFGLGTTAPRIEAPFATSLATVSPKPPDPPTRAAVNLPVPITVALPPPVMTLPTAPPIDLVQPKSTAAADTDHPPALPPKSAVAGFSQRATPEAPTAMRSAPPTPATKPPTPAQTKAAAIGKVGAKAAAPKESAGKAGKFLHWDGQRPIWDD